MRCCSTSSTTTPRSASAFSTRRPMRSTCSSSATISAARTVRCSVRPSSTASCCRTCKRLIDLGHAYRLKVQLHCCGGFEPLIPAMIAAGLDGLHAIQPCCRGMDLATLKARYGEAILFNGAIDSHHVLITGTPESVRRPDARGLADHGSRRRLHGRGQPRLHPGRDARRECGGHV